MWLLVFFPFSCFLPPNFPDDVLGLEPRNERVLLLLVGQFQLISGTFHQTNIRRSHSMEASTADRDCEPNWKRCPKENLTKSHLLLRSPIQQYWIRPERGHRFFLLIFCQMKSHNHRRKNQKCHKMAKSGEKTLVIRSPKTEIPKTEIPNSESRNPRATLTQSNADLDLTI
jgi:hypothetical protein